MWRSVACKNAREAEKSARGRVLLVPWLVLLFVWIPVGGWLRGELGLATFVSLWAFLSVVVDRKAIQMARQNLETQLPLWALRRAMGEFEHYDGWRSLGRALGRRWATRSA